jgi:uncharacterized membrane protein
VKLPTQDPIIDPALRPLEPKKTSPPRRRVGFVLLAVGFLVVVIGRFVSFGQWLFIAGSILVLLSLFLVGTYRFRAPEQQEDIRKLYGDK